MSRSHTLDEHDVRSLRDLYGQLHTWARHHETVTMSANVTLLSVTALFIGLTSRPEVRTVLSWLLWGVPIGLSVLGIAFTLIQFREYANVIRRLIDVEQRLGFYDGLSSTEDPHWTINPLQLQRAPVLFTPVGRAFIGIHLVLIASTTVLWIASSPT